MQSLRILLVDTNRHGHVVRRSALEDLGYVVDTAEDAQQALTQFEQGPFDLVVTDFRLADLGGPELIARLRESNPRVRAIILSGFVASLGLTEAETGADALVTKGPNEVRQLISAIAQVLRPRARSSSTSRPAGANRNGSPRRVNRSA